MIERLLRPAIYHASAARHIHQGEADPKGIAQLAVVLASGMAKAMSGPVILIDNDRQRVRAGAHGIER